MTFTKLPRTLNEEVEISSISSAGKNVYFMQNNESVPNVRLYSTDSKYNIIKYLVLIYIFTDISIKTTQHEITYQLFHSMEATVFEKIVEK